MNIGLYYKLFYYNNPKLIEYLLLLKIIKKNNLTIYIFISKRGYFVYKTTNNIKSIQYNIIPYNPTLEEYTLIQLKKIDLEYE